jgi:aryl-alcohol dehydrogenase-like predicted oxidoreductase
MKHVNLGTLDVGRIGLGAMGMSGVYTGAGSNDAESLLAIHRALDLGVTQGTKRASRVEENVAADSVELSPEQVDKLNNLTPAVGGHHNEAQMRMIER